MIETALLNAMIVTRDTGVLARHSINNERHFRDHKCTFTYVQRHLAEYGELPSIESTIIGAVCTCDKKRCQPFEAMDVVESIDTLALKLVERNLKLDARRLLEDVAQNFGTLDGYQVLSRLKDGVDGLTDRQSARTNSGVNWTTSGEERLAEFEQRKGRDYGVKIPILFDEITQATGGAELGEYITIMAATKRGKSWLGGLQAIVCNDAGYNVLIESAEMSKSENLFRLDTMKGGFSNRGLWTGRLDDDAQRRYYDYLDGFKRGTGKADLIVKTPEDWPDGLTLRQLQDDVERTKAQVVVVDQFNLMRFKTSSRDDKGALSRQLKQLAAKMGFVLVLLYQTNGEYVKGTSKTDEGVREIELPSTGDYSETIAVIQDSNKVIGFDAVTWKDEATGRQRGKGLVGVLESRSGGAGTEVELLWAPDDGIMRPRSAMDLF